MAKRTIDDIDVSGKRVLVREDFNVPLDGDGRIIDDRRIRAALPTLWGLLEKGSSVVLMSHLGRPRGQVRPGLSLEPIVQELHGHLGTSAHLAPDCIGPETADLAAELKPEERAAPREPALPSGRGGQRHPTSRASWPSSATAST